jgi:hypothetical protein
MALVLCAPQIARPQGRREAGLIPVTASAPCPGMDLKMDALTGSAMPDDYPRLLMLDVENISELSF